MPTIEEKDAALVAACDAVRREAEFLRSHQPDPAGRTAVADRLDKVADDAFAAVTVETDVPAETEAPVDPAASAAPKPKKNGGDA